MIENIVFKGIDKNNKTFKKKQCFFIVFGGLTCETSKHNKTFFWQNVLLFKKKVESTFLII